MANASGEVTMYRSHRKPAGGIQAWLTAVRDRLSFDERCEHDCCPPGHGHWLIHLSDPADCTECARVQRQASA